LLARGPCSSALLRLACLIVHWWGAGSAVTRARSSSAALPTKSEARRNPLPLRHPEAGRSERGEPRRPEGVRQAASGNAQSRVSNEKIGRIRPRIDVSRSAKGGNTPAAQKSRQGLLSGLIAPLSLPWRQKPTASTAISISNQGLAFLQPNRPELTDARPSSKPPRPDSHAGPFL
jgi:hypothetical protein